MRPRTFTHPLILLALLTVGWMISPVDAAVIQVNLESDAIDVDPADGLCDSDAALAGLQCTLRAAIMTAEVNGEADRIEIPQGFLINLDLGGEGDAALGDLDIGTEIEVVGFIDEPPADPLQLPTISAFALNDRIFDVLNGQLTVRGIRFQGGNPEFSGGVIDLSGNATARAEVSFSNFLLNQASRGGAIAVTGFAELLVEDSNFIRNDSLIGSGAAIFLQSQASATIRRSSFVDNRSGTPAGDTIGISSSGTVVIENSTLDGAELAPPLAGRFNGSGIVTFDNGLNLTLLNTTVSRFPEEGLRLTNVDSETRLRISHSILSANDDGCFASGADLNGADALIEYSLLSSEFDCGDFISGGSLLNASPDLSDLTQDDAPRLTFSRPPIGLDANVVERGFLPGDLFLQAPEIDCAATDQRGNPRPQDADADGDARCDLGAVEEGPPTTFIVDYFDQDLLDSNPGDGQCTTIIIPGFGSVCTLRAAIMETNALPGLQRILFEPSATPAVLTQPASPSAAGGDLNITDTVAIEGLLDNGRPATVIQNQVNGERLFNLQSGVGDIYLRNLELTGGQSGTGAGGAIVQSTGTVTGNRLVIRGNFGGPGGGGVAILGGTLLLEDSDLLGNDTIGSGAAALLTGGSLGLLNTSVRGHLGLLPDASPKTSIVAFEDTQLSMLNATISGNQKGILADRPTGFTLLQSTLNDNIAGSLDLVVDASSAILMSNSLFTNSSPSSDDCLITDLGLAAESNIDYLFSSDGSCDPYDDNAQSGDPLLGPLERPGGQVSYSHAPSRDPALPSPALDAAPESSCAGLFDQYRRMRAIDLPEIPNLDGPCDLGSLEALGDGIFSDRFELIP